MIALLQRYAKQSGKPFMSLTFDEHTAETGLITRLEAFIDMVQRRKKTGSRYVHVPHFVREGREQEKISALGIPNLGDKFAAFRTLAQQLNISLVVPPVTKHTLSLGTRYSPEFACLPFKGILGTFIECLEQIPRDPKAMPIKIGIVGEMYVVMEPFSNMNLEIELGKMGVEVRRTRSTFFSEWTGFSRFLNALNDEKKELQKFAQPYLKRDVGGHGLESVGEKVRRAGDYDGIIHLAPLTCMPRPLLRISYPLPGRLSQCLL